MLDPKYVTFIEVVKSGSFTKAADKLCLTQPAVSNQIKAIENEFEVKIFDRKMRALTLTPEGEILYKYAQRMETLTENAHRAIKDSLKEVRLLSVGLTHTSKENYAPHVLARFCNENPDTHIKIFIDGIKNIYKRLKIYEIDLAIIDGNYSDDNFLAVLLDVDYLCLAVATTHPFARLKSVSLGQLKKEPFILRPVKSNSRTLFENHLISRGENIDSFNVIMEVDSITTIKELVARGLGVTIIAYSAVKADVMKGNLSVIPVENLSMPREINLVYHKDFEHKEILNEIYRIYQEEKNLAGEGRLT